MTTTVQLRRYQLEPGSTPAFLAWFPTLLPVRAQFGFRVLFALSDAEHDTFTWAVELDGDRAEFDRVQQTYHHSAERARVFETFPHCVTTMELGFVDAVPGLSPRA